MPLVAIGRFGQFEYDESGAIEFPVGLPGFEQHHRFVVVEQPGLAPLVFLQSLESPDLSLPAVPVTLVDPRYEMGVTPDDQELLGLDMSRQPAPGREVLCLAILTAPPDGRPTANLLAPVVINLSRCVGVQAVRADTRYSHRHVLGEPCS
jgi:flagellar assembly factor FliW